MSKGHKSHLPGAYVHVRSTGQPEFYEDDIWLTSSSSVAVKNQEGREAHRNVGGLSLAFQGRTTARGPRLIPRAQQQRRNAAAASAAVDVPSCPGSAHGGSVEADDVEEDDDMAEWVPPHEYVARRLSRSGEGRSVVEGLGRTLKGRDLSRVRDAVWTRTGFFG